MPGTRKSKASSRRSGRAPSGTDSSVWRLPQDPISYSLRDFPFTICLSAKDFKMDKTGTLTYPVVCDSLEFLYKFRANSIAVQVHAFGAYASSGSGSGLLPLDTAVTVQDAYTGRVVVGWGTPVKRARAGVSQTAVRRMKWYSQSSPDTESEKELAYMRNGTSLDTCSSAGLAFTGLVVVKGVARVSPIASVCQP